MKNWLEKVALVLTALLLATAIAQQPTNPPGNRPSAPGAPPSGPLTQQYRPCTPEEREWSCSGLCRARTDTGEVDNGCTTDHERTQYLLGKRQVTYPPLAAQLCGTGYSEVLAVCNRTSVVRGAYNCNTSTVECRYRKERDFRLVPCTPGLQDEIDRFCPSSNGQHATACVKKCFADTGACFATVSCTWEQDPESDYSVKGPFSAGDTCFAKTGRYATEAAAGGGGVDDDCDGFDVMCTVEESVTTCGSVARRCTKRCNAFNRNQCRIFADTCSEETALMSEVKVQPVPCTAVERDARMCRSGVCMKRCDAFGQCTSTFCAPEGAERSRNETICGREKPARALYCTVSGFWECESTDYGWFSGDKCQRFEPAVSCPHGAWNAVTGLCECESGWTGELCEHRICPDDCNSASGAGSCDVATGTCICNAGYGGDRCQADCTENPCQNEGVCVADGVCSCKPHWTGAACESYSELICTDEQCVCSDSTKIGYNCELDAVALCAINCNGHGSCLPDNDNSSLWSCVCEAGWTGNYCQDRDTDPENVCSTPCVHGICVAGQCVCYETWEGADCSVSKCTGPGQSPPAVDSFTASCEQKRRCTYPYRSDMFEPCQLERNVCRNGGVVNTETRSCQCPFPFTGPTCEQSLCGKHSLRLQSGASRCECADAYWTGAVCRTSLCTDGVSSFSEIELKCVCSDTRFQGQYCSSLICDQPYKVFDEHTRTCKCSSTLSVYTEDCEQHRCGPRGAPTAGGNRCTCPSLFHFDSDVEYPGTMCVPSCLYGTMDPRAGGVCSCNRGYAGDRCQYTEEEYKQVYVIPTPEVPITAPSKTEVVVSFTPLFSFIGFMAILGVVGLSLFIANYVKNVKGGKSYKYTPLPTTNSDIPPAPATVITASGNRRRNHVNPNIHHFDD